MKVLKEWRIWLVYLILLPLLFAVLSPNVYTGDTGLAYFTVALIAFPFSLLQSLSIVLFIDDNKSLIKIILQFVSGVLLLEGLSYLILDSSFLFGKISSTTSFETALFKANVISLILVLSFKTLMSKCFSINSK